MQRLQVLISFLTAALVTTTASVVAAWLDCKLGNAQAVLPARYRTGIFSEATGATARRCAFWRMVLERLVLSLADQQLITGISLLLSGFITERDALEGRQMALIMNLSFLSSSSHLVCVMTLCGYFKRHMEVAYLRISAIILYAYLLCWGTLMTDQPVFLLLIPNTYLVLFVLLSLVRADIRLRFRKWLSEASREKIQKQVDRFRKQIDRFRKKNNQSPFLNLVGFRSVIGSFIISIYTTLRQRLSPDNE